MAIKRVYIEITNRCNLRCSFCSFHNREFDEMTLTHFEELIKQIKPITPYIYLHVQGEPLLHSKFEEIMTHCDYHNMKVQLVTNGTYLNKYMDLAKHSSLRKISFSLHSLDYQTIAIEDYMNNILFFIENHNRNDLYTELRFWTSDNLSTNATTALSLIKNRYNLVETNKPNSFKLNDNIFLHFEKQFEWPTTAKRTPSLYGTCRGGKDMIAILVDGTVIPCCLDAEGEIVLGNTKTHTIQSILNSDRYLSIIKGFNDNQLIEPLCQKCTYRNRFN